MPKVLIVSPSAYLYGGVESILHDLCAILPSHGWDAVLGLVHGRYFHNVDRYIETFPELPIYPIRSNFPSRASRTKAIYRVIRRLDPDLVLVARIGDAYEAVGKHKELYGKPRLAMALRGFEAQYLVDARVFEPIIDMCITDGRLIANACIKLAGIEQQRVVSLPGGVRLPTDIVEPRETGELLRLTYIGRLQHSDKRVLDLITLTDKLAILGVPFSLDIVGAGPEEAHLRKELSKRISDEKLRFHGWVSRNYLYSNILPNVDCLLNFSPTEGVTISPREGMVNGVVPVISEFPGLALEGQFLHEVNALTFPVENIERAAHCVCRLWSEPGLLSKLSRAALTSQVGKYTQGGSMLEWANAFNISMTMPLKISKTEIPSQQHSGRLENLGVPPVIADTCRFFTGRQPVPDDPGSEWPHGRIRVTANDLHLLKNFSDNIDSR